MHASSSWKVRWFGLAVLALAGHAWAQGTPLFFDDVESGTLLQSDTPAGRWSTCFPAPCDMLAATGAAAHRGAYGVRITDADADPDGGTGSVINGLKKSFPTPVSGDLYLRAWFRFSASSPAAARIALWTVQNAGNSVIQAINLQLPEGTVVSGGNEVVGGQAKFVVDGTSQVLSQGDWHLVEIALLGLGTSQGQRRMWIDRAELFSHPVDWSGGEGWTAVKFVLGELNGDRIFTGTIDYDDVMADLTPLPSHLGVIAPAQAVVNGCIPLEVEARDTLSERPAPARHPLSVTLHAQGAGNLYASGDCSGAAGGNALALSLADGEQAATASFRPLQRGSVQLSAEAPDLLPGTPAATTITGPSVRLAFVSAGAIAFPGSCSPEVRIGQQDDAGAWVVDGVSREITLSAPVPLFGDPSCATPISALTLDADAGVGSVYFQGDAAATFTLSAETDGLSPAQQEEEITTAVARVTAPTQVAADVAFSLDGRGSSPSKGAQLAAFRWIERAGPTGVQLADAPVQSLHLREPGDYVFELQVSDSAGQRSAPAVAALHVEGSSPAAPTLGGCASAGSGVGGAGLLALAAWWWRRRAAPPRRRG